MPLSRRELRKIEKALRRTQYERPIRASSDSFSPAKGRGQGRTGIAASASADTTDGQLKRTESVRSKTARSLTETFASLAVQRPSPAPEIDRSSVDNAGTVRSVALHRSLLGSPCSDPFVDSSEQTTPGKGAIIAKLATTGTCFSPVPTSKPGSPQDEYGSFPCYQSTSDDLCDKSMPSPGRSDVTPSTPVEFHDAQPQSLDGTMENISNFSLASGYLGDTDHRSGIKIRRAKKAHDRTKEHSPSAAFKSAARPPPKCTDFPIPTTLETGNPDAPCRDEAARDSLSQGTTLVDHGQFDGMPSANGLQTQGTSPAGYPQLHHTFQTGRGRPLPYVPAARIVRPSSMSHAPGPPIYAAAGYHSFDSPTQSSSAFDWQLHNSSLQVHDNGCFDRQLDSVFLRRSVLAHRKLPLTSRMDRYQLSGYETRWETRQRMRHADWMQDGRAHNRSLSSIAPELRYADREQDYRGYMTSIPKPAENDTSTRMMNEIQCSSNPAAAAVSVDGNLGRSQGHVNNVTYVRYAESARINWAQNYAKYHDPTHKKQWEELWTPKGDGLILRSIKTDFKFPMSWPDRISVYHKLRAPPSNTSESFILDVLILSERHQRAAARCVEDIVVYDYRRGRKTPLMSFMLAQFKKTWEAQEAARKKNEAKVEKLLARVRRLEIDSWDREGAVEDMGSR
ncbi:MAG: hypothetical protein Q9193_000858 [Seirophora villosa]